MAFVLCRVQHRRHELGLDPNEMAASADRGGTVAYWRVSDINRALEHFIATGAMLVSPAQDVGEGIKLATEADPFDNLIGLIENPHFELPNT